MGILPQTEATSMPPPPPGTILVLIEISTFAKLLPLGSVVIGQPLWRCVHAFPPGLTGTACLQTLWPAVGAVASVAISKAPYMGLDPKHGASMG